MRLPQSEPRALFLHARAGESNLSPTLSPLSLITRILIWLPCVRITLCSFRCSPLHPLHALALTYRRFFYLLRTLLYFLLCLLLCVPQEALLTHAWSPCVLSVKGLDETATLANKHAGRRKVCMWKGPRVRMGMHVGRNDLGDGGRVEYAVKVNRHVGSIDVVGPAFRLAQEVSDDLHHVAAVVDT